MGIRDRIRFAGAGILVGGIEFERGGIQTRPANPAFRGHGGKNRIGRQGDTDTAVFEIIDRVSGLGIKATGRCRFLKILPVKGIEQRLVLQSPLDRKSVV